MRDLKIPAVGEPLHFSYGMISGLAVQGSHVYTMHVEPSGRRWCVAADVPNRADHIYVDGGEGSRGFGGRRMKFPLLRRTSDFVHNIVPLLASEVVPDDRPEVEFIGPWHSNADALFKSTGFDVRNEHITWCCIGTGHSAGFSIEKVLWRDGSAIIGSFDRPDVVELAQHIANDLGATVYMHKETSGGSSNTPYEPK